MDYFSLGSEISYPDYNAIVYLLRKFKRLTSDLRLGSNRIGSDYGTYSVTGGLTSVGGNFILEDNVTISSNDVLLNCFYTFFFTVVDVNLSGTVNRRVISVTGDTGDNGELEVVLEPSLLESDEVILPDFKVDIVFDEHEYYTPVSSLDITLTVDKSYISVGESNTVTATVVDGTGSPVEDLTLQFSFNGDIVTDVTDSSGVASAEYTGTGVGWVTVIVSDKSIQFFDGYVTIAEFTGGSITLGENTFQSWLGTVGDVVIDWGDGSTSTVNNPNRPLTHNYNDGLSSHEIMFFGEVTNLGENCFYNCTGLTSVTIPDSVVSLERYCFYKCTGLTSVTIPNSVTSLGQSCFIYCTGLTSVTIPNSVTSLGNTCFAGCTGLTTIMIPDSVVSLGRFCFHNCTGLTSITIPSSIMSLGDNCFNNCTGLIDYQLYWQTPPNTWKNSEMPNNPNTIFTIPYETSNNYLSKNYPSNKLRERGLNLQITTDKPIIQSTETSTITATLTHETTPLTSKTLSYQIKHGNTVISSGTKTTNSSGQATISYTGTGVGDVSVIVSYGSLLQETFVLYDSWFYDSAVTGTASNNWFEFTTSGTKTVGNDGTILSNSNSTQYMIYANKPGTTTDVYDWNSPYIVEFDIISSSGSGKYIQFYSSTTSGNFVTDLVAGHYKITYDGTTFTVDKDGIITTSAKNIPSARIGFVVYTDSNVKFKDFKIYSI